MAIGASSKGRAEAFANKSGIARAYGDYRALLDDEQVDAVYLALANGLHLEWAAETARADKACLCEKPMVLSARDAHDLHALYGESGRRLQEAFMWRHHPQIEWLSEELNDGRIGELRRINAVFSFRFDRPENYRWKADQGGGSLWDVGCYCVDAARFFFKAEPVAASIRAMLRPEPDAVDESAAGWIDFGEGRLATLSCSFTSAYNQGLEILGTEGRAWLGKPWGHVDTLTRVAIEKDGERTWRDFEPTDAYVDMVRHFSRAVRDPDYALHPAEGGLAQAIAMEGIQQSAKNAGEIWRADRN